MQTKPDVPHIRFISVYTSWIDGLSGQYENIVWLFFCSSSFRNKTFLISLFVIGYFFRVFLVVVDWRAHTERFEYTPPKDIYARNTQKNNPSTWTGCRFSTECYTLNVTRCLLLLLLSLTHTVWCVYYLVGVCMVFRVSGPVCTRSAIEKSERTVIWQRFACIMYTRLSECAIFLVRIRMRKRAVYKCIWDCTFRLSRCRRCMQNRRNGKKTKDFYQSTRMRFLFVSNSNNSREEELFPGDNFVSLGIFLIGVA